MTERENLPAKLTTQGLVVTTEMRGSLVARGIAALRTDNDALYRQARAVFDRRGGVDENPAIPIAFKIFQRLADENYGKAYFPLSSFYSDKLDIAEDQDRALHFARLAFDWCFDNKSNQDVELWRDLGVMYRLGRGVEKDYEQSLYWIHKAAEQGDAAAQWQLGMMYGEGRYGVGQDGELQIYWFRKAAEQGYADAQYMLGLVYQNGHLVEINYEQAVYWYRKAAEQGNSSAQDSLGKMYKEGSSVTQDDEQGISGIQNNLGNISNQLDKLPQNLRKEVINLTATRMVLDRIKKAKASLKDKQNTQTKNTERNPESDPIERAMHRIQHRREQEMQGMTEQELKEYMINELLAQDRMLDQMEEVEAANKAKYSPKA